MRLTQFLEQSANVTDLDRLFEQLVGFAESLGFTWVAYGSPSRPDRTGAATAAYPFVFSNFPEGWQRRYIESGYSDIDPTLWRCRHAEVAFRWQDLEADPELDSAGRRFLREVEAFGLMAGVTVPLHGPSTNIALVNFARHHDGAVSDDELMTLQMAAGHFHLTNARLIIVPGDEAVRPNLSHRERECLHWSSLGKSSWEISMILGISEHTVNFHIKHAMQKLDTQSRIVAVAKALRMGIIP